jgi:N-formylglutamate amidohydrolase
MWRLLCGNGLTFSSVPKACVAKAGTVRQTGPVSDMAAPPAFLRHGPAIPAFPVIIAVPHSGRYYASSLIADAAVHPSRLRLLEDRYADLLVARSIEQGATAFVAGHARAWIDLNRDPREIDAGMIEGVQPAGLLASNRTRHGLGLIPRHIGDSAQIWRRKFTHDEIERRIAAFHKPYHDAIAAALAAARARFGIAILIDCHSMPPIRQSERHTPPPAIVIGDRFGRSADGRYGDLIEGIARQAGFPAARNAPYAGGYSLDRHGAPRRQVHALQIEIDRSRYLDSQLDGAGDGIEETAALMTRIFDALCEDSQATPQPVAAE